jgi:hypothetical protein
MCAQHIAQQDRPDEAFTTDRAVRAGRANAASGRIMVTVPGDHFGPIPPEADPRGLVRLSWLGWPMCCAHVEPVRLRVSVVRHRHYGAEPLLKS